MLRAHNCPSPDPAGARSPPRPSILIRAFRSRSCWHPRSPAALAKFADARRCRGSGSEMDVAARARVVPPMIRRHLHPPRHTAHLGPLCTADLQPPQMPAHGLLPLGFEPLEPWIGPPDDGAALVADLKAELRNDSGLYALESEAVEHRCDCDDALFKIPGRACRSLVRGAYCQVNIRRRGWRCSPGSFNCADRLLRSYQQHPSDAKNKMGKTRSSTPPTQIQIFSLVQVPPEH